MDGLHHAHRKLLRRFVAPGAVKGDDRELVVDRVLELLHARERVRETAVVDAEKDLLGIAQRGDRAEGWLERCEVFAARCLSRVSNGPSLRIGEILRDAADLIVDEREEPAKAGADGQLEEDAGSYQPAQRKERDPVAAPLFFHARSLS